jgi:phosphatidylglycerol:prolipoprotein diacylglycerol transferase
MKQVILEITLPFTGKHVPIFGFGLMMCLGFFGASWLISRMARREGLGDRVTDLALWIFIWGIVGARVLYMVQNPALFENPLNFFKIWEGGIVFYGGVIIAIPVFLLYCRRHALPPWQVLDVLAPGIALGIGIGRFGCLLNGCCWGKPTELPWAITFPANSSPFFSTRMIPTIPWQDHVHQSLVAADAAHSLPVHPTQVYLALAGWLLLLLTLLYFPRRRRHGEVMALLMIGYAVTRFGIEFFRADEALWADGLTISQNISIILFAGGLLLWAWLRRSPAITSALPATVHPASR